MKKSIKKLLRNFLKLFIRIDRIPFNDNGVNCEYCTMYVFGLAFTSHIYKSQN